MDMSTNLWKGALIIIIIIIVIIYCFTIRGTSYNMWIGAVTCGWGR